MAASASSRLVTGGAVRVMGLFFRPVFRCRRGDERAAVDGERLAGDEGGLVRGEERHGVAAISSGSAEPPDGHCSELVLVRRPRAPSASAPRRARRR